MTRALTIAVLLAEGAMTSITDRLVEMTPGGRIPFKLQLAAFAVVFVVMLLAGVASAAAQAPDSPKPGDCWKGPHELIICHGGSLLMSSEATWHLFTQSHGGTVSLLHGLTKEVCEKSRKLAFNDQWAFDASGNIVGRAGIHLGPGTIIRAECFQ